MLKLIRNKPIFSVSKVQFSNSIASTKIGQNEEFDKLYKRVQLELKGNDPTVMKSFVQFATSAGNHLDVQSETWNLRKPTHTKYTLLKAVHIYKKHRVQYEYRTYYSFINFKHLTESTANTLLEYIQRNLPEGVALKTTTVELQKIPDHLLKSNP